jgi:serine/threonine-protein kinase RsbW
MNGDRGTAPGRSQPAERSDFILELPSDLRVIEAAVAYLADRLHADAFRGSRLELNFRVGLSEALANAVLYGNRGDPSKCVRVEVTLDERSIALRVIDQGSGFDPDAVPDPTLPENLERPGGRGLFLLRELMDEVEYNDRGNAVRLVLFREPGRSRSASPE